MGLKGDIARVAAVSNSELKSDQDGIESMFSGLPWITDSLVEIRPRWD